MKYKTDFYESKRGSDGLFHFLYKTTNNLNKKYYIGVHNTIDLGDGYKGSGDILRKAIKKYGVKNFSREILEFFDTDTQAYDKERIIVNSDLINDPMCYNSMIGGKGNLSKMLPVKHVQTGKTMMMSIDDPRYGAEYVSVNKGTIPVKHKLTGEIRRIHRDEFDNEIWENIHTGKIVLFNTITKTYEQVDINDPRRLEGILISASTNKITVTDGDKCFQVDKNHPDYLSGKLKLVQAGRWTLRNKKTGECISVLKGSDVDWNIYEFSTCRPKKQDNPNLIKARLIGDKKYRWYEVNDPRLETCDLLLPMAKNQRKIYLTNGDTDIALHESEIDRFLKYHSGWKYGHRNYKTTQ